MTRRTGEMNQKQIITTLVAAGIIAVCSVLWATYNTSVSNRQVLESRAEYITKGDARYNSLELRVSEVERKQGLSDLELSYSRQDREAQSELVKENVNVLRRVDKSLDTFEVKIVGELNSLKKEVAHLNERLDKAGL